MEGKLTVEVTLDDIDPGGISWQTLQLLKSQQDFSIMSDALEPFNEQLSALTHLEFSSILFPFDFSPSEVEPGPATQGWRDPFLTSFFHLFYHHIHCYSLNTGLGHILAVLYLILYSSWRLGVAPIANAEVL